VERGVEQGVERSGECGGERGGGARRERNHLHVFWMELRQPLKNENGFLASFAFLLK